VLEYGALVVGYRVLLVVVAALYLLAFVCRPEGHREGGERRGVASVEASPFSIVRERAERDVVTLHEIDEALDSPILTRASTHGAAGINPSPQLRRRWEL
jgi:hypothetical protein